MSGPKGYQVQLSQAVRRAQAEVATRARCRALISRRDTAAARLEALTAAPAPAPAHKLQQQTLEQLQSLEHDLTEQVQQLEHLEHDAQRAAVRQQLRQSFRDITSAINIPTAAPGAPPAASHSATWARNIAHSLARCIDRMSTLDDAARTALMPQIDTVRTALTAGNAAGADHALLDIQTACERAARAQRERDAIRQQTDALTLRTADLTGPEADRLRARALACTTRAELVTVQRDEQTLRASLEAQRNRAYVIDQTSQALRDLGYEVGAEFTALACDKPVIVRRPDLPDHGVELTFVPQAARVLTRVVAFGATSTQRDTEVETITCQDLTRLQGAWQNHGIEATLFHHNLPGTMPVKRTAAQPRQRPAAEHRERNLP